MNVILSLLVLAGLLFGGGATVNAAQDDLPNQPLYSIKTMSEDVSLQFQSEPEEKVWRLMELSQVRLQEMERLVEAGQPVPDQVRLRLEQHIRQALQVCADMDESAVDPLLLQIRDRLRQQDRDMEQLQNHSTQAAQPHFVADAHDAPATPAAGGGRPAQPRNVPQYGAQWVPPWDAPNCNPGWPAHVHTSRDKHRTGTFHH